MGCSCAKHLKEEQNNTYNIPTEENQLAENNLNQEEANNDLINNNNDKINNNDFITNTKTSEKLKSYIKLNKEINDELNFNEQFNPELNEKKDSNNNKNTKTYIEITTDKITKEDLNNFLLEYPPLDSEENINLELRPPNLLENDIIYYGEWDPENNLRHGRGIQIWPNGEKYEGYWKQGHSNGKGKLYHINGDIYEGDWENDLPQGNGKYLKKNGEFTTH